jgi:hypothetical protein
MAYPQQAGSLFGSKQPSILHHKVENRIRLAPQEESLARDAGCRGRFRKRYSLVS